MKPKLLPFSASALACLIAATDAYPAATSEAYPQDGVWKPISATLAGTKIPAPTLNAITLRIAGTTYEVSVLGERQPDRGKHLLDQTITPNRITITSTNGPNKGKTFLGIYEVRDTNSLRVCYDLSGAAFPTNFESTVETGYYLAEYRRSHKQPAKPSDAAEDAKRQNGSWKPAGAMLRGQRLQRQELDKITLTIKDGSYQVAVDGEAHSDKGTLSLDTSVTPKRMTLQALEGPNQGKRILAIYEMAQTPEGTDTFRICYDLSGTAYPTRFSSSKGSSHYLVGYRRKKDSAP